SIKPDELSVLRHVHLIGDLLSDIIETAVQTSFENIGHGDEFDGATCRLKRVVGCPRAAPTTPDQGDLDHIGMRSGAGRPRGLFGLLRCCVAAGLAESSAGNTRNGGKTTGVL